jgi:ADP-heptose:LPS heptosyltransferase
MFNHLQIYHRRERALVGAADAVLGVVAPVLTAGRRAPARPPERILLLRLERIGDLLMSLEAIEDVRRAAPAAAIDLVVGSWNVELARRIPGITSVESMDAPWLSREGGALPFGAMLRRARGWRTRRYDLAIDFEPDIRSNLLLAASRSARTAGFASGGGGALLDVALEYRPDEHTSENARRLAAAVLDVPARTRPTRLQISVEDRRAGVEAFRGRPRPIVGMHVSGGRAIKQWDVGRFAELAAWIGRARGATIVLTGSAADREMVATVVRTLDPILDPVNVVDLCGALDLPALAGTLEQLDVFVTGDTGPMHVAAAVGTPVVAVFGPSNPVRYAPRDPIHTIVRVDLPCSPCNRIRLPPERCVGHTPDCLTGIDVDMVFRAVQRTLDASRRQRDPQLGAAIG